MPALKASSSLPPKHTSKTGARCSNLRSNVPWPSSPFTSYRCTCLSHEAASNLDELGAKESAETASAGGGESSYWIARKAHD